MLNRVGLARVARQVSSRRVSVLCRARGKSVPRRCYSASAGGQGSASGGSPLYWSLGAAAALSAIYFVYPFEKKAKQEPKADLKPEAEQQAGEEPAVESEKEPESVAEDSEEEPQQATEEVRNSEPTKENTVSSTDSKQSTKSIMSDEELQKVEEAQLEPTNQEAEKEGAYNPDTGEINWDCPCLGGMAHGPCGEEFKLAFSCFVFSEAEPKGIDCVEKFQGMQECFRKYPDYYAEQIKDEDEAVAVHEDKLAAATTGEEAKQGTSAVDQPDEKGLPEPASTAGEASAQEDKTAETSG
ncbi:hypothetical protein HG536_0C05630 [Torulaspora globosa]|uniref:Mitochondrial intermembrane space import and assembly protein 40 n=1 Tax=Torulaspora globosa TaxID=48254 RepID=A0A7G3ZFV8_9SACH|nr:uncharacterized protein HG536_0C05630 [Torulaspora globosa]QLL32394.1 hypothetical protein HG536_0C05630 [Torulaspora globosa]